jgi:homoserine kinase
MAKPTYRAQPVQVQVPATSANLGPGFDCFGLALGMHDRYVAQILDDVVLDIDITGEGSTDLPRSDKNLLVKSMYKGFEYLGGKPRGLAVRALNVIPHGRGLGSSASAIVGGLTLARSLVLGGNEQMSDDVLLNLATEMEGHPDNVAAAIYGGATIAWQEVQHGKNVALSINMEVDARIGAVAFIPTNAISTSKARKHLPELIPHEDAVANSAHSALMVHALTQRPDLLFTATADFLHQQYRQDLMPLSFTLMNKLRSAGVPAFISGAGPTVLVLHTGGASDIAEMERAAGDKFAVTPLSISRAGASVVTA